MRDFDFGDVFLSLLVLAGLVASVLLSGCAADDELFLEPDAAAHVDASMPDSAPPDAPVACRAAYVNDAGIGVEARCDDGFNCDDGVCAPCGQEGEACCRAGTWLYCEGFSCNAGTCE